MGSLATNPTNISEPDIIDYDIPDEPEIIFNQDPNEPDNIFNDNPNEHDDFFNEDPNQPDDISNDDSNELDPNPSVFPNSNPLIAEPHKDTGKQVNMYYVNNVNIHA